MGAGVKIKKRRVSVGDFLATEQMVDNATDVLRTGRLSYGKYSKAFEREFSEIHGVRYSVLSNSGTSSLLVALQALKIQRGWPNGSHVIVPATTFVATANIVLQSGMIPVFCDVEPVTFNMTAETLAQALTPQTVCIIPVHLLGRPVAMQEIVSIANRRSIAILEDSCECMFVPDETTGHMVGSIGDAAAFSVYVAHMITSGVGGISTTNDPQLATIMRSLVNHGLSLENLQLDEDGSPAPVMTDRRFLFSYPGHSFRITELEAAVALPQLREHRRILAIRQRNAHHLLQGQRNLNKHYGDELFIVPSRENSSFMMCPVMLNPRIFPDTAKADLRAWLALGDIETRDIPSLVPQPLYEEYLQRESYPVSHDIWDYGMYVGCHQYMKTHDCSYVVQEIGRWVSEFVA